MNAQNKYKPAKLYFDQYIPNNCDSILPPIIFVHGLCSLHTTWHTVWKRIANETQRKVFAIDIRNHGRSEWNDFFTLELLVADLENFLTENGIKKCALVAHSLSGRTAMYLALRKPELVDRLVVEESRLGDATADEKDLVRTLSSFSRQIKFLPKDIAESEIRKLLSMIVEEKFPGWEHSDMAFTIPLRRDDHGFSFNFNAPVFEKSTKEVSAFNIDFRKCQKFSGPALFIFAEESQAKVEEDGSITEYFPNAELCKLTAKSHILHIDCPNEYVEKVSTFINS